MSEERRSSETLLLDAKKYAKKLTVTSEEVKLLFEERKELLREPEQRYIQQILVDDKNKADQIYKNLNDKKDNFLKVAKEEANLLKKILILVGIQKVKCLKKLLMMFSRLKLINTLNLFKVLLVGILLKY